MKWPVANHLAGYMNRWWLLSIGNTGKRNTPTPGQEVGARELGWFNMRVHQILRSDTDRHMHDHPFNYLTIVLWGGYLETTIDGTKWRGPGSVIFARAERLHRLTLIEGRPAWTLFMFGRTFRDWGFQTRAGWVSWRDYRDTNNVRV